MIRPTKRSMKKVIYLEMIILSVLLAVAVVVVSRYKNTSPDPQPDNTQAAATETQPKPTEPAPTWKTYPEDRAITAQQYFVFDQKANKFLIKSGAETDRVDPAGITKLFTAYTICETMIVNPNKICTVDQDVLDLVPAGTPVANLKVGDKVTARKLLEGMLICGGNDAAYMLAREAGRNFSGQLNMSAEDAVRVFVAEMNQLAKEKGMLDTNFTNPAGIPDSNQYTTMHDLVVLGNLCGQYNSITDPVFAPEVDIRLHDETVIWTNINELINPKSEYYCSHAFGLHAGQSPNGFYMLSSFRKGEQRLLIGVFGCSQSGDRFDDTLQLFNRIVLN